MKRWRMIVNKTEAHLRQFAESASKAPVVPLGLLFSQDYKRRTLRSVARHRAEAGIILFRGLRSVIVNAAALFFTATLVDGQGGLRPVHKAVQ